MTFDLTNHIAPRQAAPQYHFVHGLGYHAVTVRGETKHFWTRREAQDFMFALGGEKIAEPTDPVQELVERYL